MGLLQEGLITVRCHDTLWSSISVGQSRYNQGTEDPILLLHELTACRISLSLGTWLAMGDFARAFPRTDRSDLLDLVADDGNITSGVLALLGDMLKGDALRVWLSGTSGIPVVTGLPEGGTLGPALSDSQNRW